MRLLPAVILTSAIACSVFGQTYTINTVAGGGLPNAIPGKSASLGSPAGVAVDGAGNIYVAVQSKHVVFRLDTNGLLTIVAGTGGAGFSGDNGPAASAQLNSPRDVAVDASGNVYIADEANRRIRKVSNGIITTLAGGGTSGLGDNGPAINAQLILPTGVAVDTNGNVYIADAPDNRIRKISNGVIATIAGNGTPGFSGDGGQATSAQLSGPWAVSVDSAGNVYTADQANYRIREISNGVITTVAGNGTSGFSGDNGAATVAQIAAPFAITVDTSGNLYIADAYNYRVRKVSGGIITTVVGNGFSSGALGDNGPATNATLSPASVTVDAGGNLYISDSANQRVRTVSGGVITTVAGNGMQWFSGDNGPATSAQVSTPVAVAVDSAGSLYFNDADGHIRKVSNGVITTIAGNGTRGGGDAPAPALISALYDPVEGVAVDSAGNVYIAEPSANRVRKLSNGVIATIAGNDTPGFSGDGGPATAAQLALPWGVAVDPAGNLYIADRGNNRIRKVSNGVITTVAGTGVAGFAGDNGPAVNAQLDGPTSIAIDLAGNLYIGDTALNSGRVRMVSNGVITTLAGGGSAQPGDNGPATSARIEPWGVAVDFLGNVFIGDGFFGAGRIRKVSNGVITTVAGGNGQGAGGDGGPATSAQINNSYGLAADSAGNIYIADTANDRIRVLIPSGAACAYSVVPTTLQVAASGGSLTTTVQTYASCAWTISGLPSWLTVSGATSGTGPATVTLVAAANTGASRSATISIADVSVSVIQQATQVCTYAISPGGQGFVAAGGRGTFNITAGQGCPWTAAGTVSWVTITAPGNGTGNGTVTYQVAANTGTARSGSITIAGLSFTIEETSASIAGFTSAGSMAQLASAGYWKTTITLINTGTAAAQARLNFFDDNGNPLLLSLYFPQSSAAGPLLSSTLDRTVNAGAALVIETTGPDNAPTQVGWAQMLTNGTIGGFAVFRQAIGSSSQEAVVPFENRNASGYVLFFDNTNGSATGVALANTSSQALNTAVTIRDDTGAVIMSDTITLPASGHTSFDLASRYASLTAQRRGTLEFRTPTNGQISVLGLKFNATGAFSTTPALAK